MIYANNAEKAKSHRDRHRDPDKAAELAQKRMASRLRKIAVEDAKEKRRTDREAARDEKRHAKFIRDQLSFAHREQAKGVVLPPETMASIQRLKDRAAKAAAEKVIKQQARGRGYVEIERLKAVRYG